ncbi:hypothetical protein RIU97_21720 [Streptomyces sp. 147326]
MGTVDAADACGQRVQRIEELVAVGHRSEPPGISDLSAEEPLTQTVEPFRVHHHVTVEELIREMNGCRLDLHHDLNCPLIVQVAAGLRDELVHVRVTTQDGERLDLLVEGPGALRARLVDRAEGATREGVDPRCIDRRCQRLHQPAASGFATPRAINSRRDNG